MQKRPLGRSGLSVSALSLGTMTYGQQVPQNEAFGLMDTALDHNVDFFDAAEMYPIPPRPETQGETEAIIGRWFAARKTRDRVIMATKVAGRTVMRHLRDGNARLDSANITQALEDSLRRLQTDYVDLYYTHWPDRKTNTFGRLDYEHDPEDDGGTPLAETAAVMDGLVKAGKIRAWGVSNETPWGLTRIVAACEAAGLTPPSVIQNPYHLLNRTFEIGHAEVSMREQVGLVAYSPLGQGVLTGKYLGGVLPENARLTLFPERYGRFLGDRVEEHTRRYLAVADRFGLSLPALALGFVITRPFVTSALMGANSQAHLAENLAAADTVLSDEVLAAITEVHLENANPVR